MTTRGSYRFKVASTGLEFDQIHRFNHETFVHEVGQCPATRDGRLIDKFHEKNTYFVAKQDEEVVGMVAVHDLPPFSIADRLDDPTELERMGRHLLEVRLLAVRRDLRHGMVMPGLLLTIIDHVHRCGYTHLLISGLRQRVPLYEKMGCRPMGRAVACGSAEFVPMSLDVARIPGSSLRFLERWQAHLVRVARREPRSISLMPGPVEVSAPVRLALANPLRSHRSAEFLGEFERVRERLGVLVGRPRGQVAIFLGSGTLTNDVVASALKEDPDVGPGLILSNGEFGDRLHRQASRIGLDARVLRFPWGRPWDLEAVADALARDRRIGWVWGVHLESSTGLLNDLDGLVEAVRGTWVRVCVDGVSSLGATPIDLAGVHLASGSSGKSLGSLGGLGFVFASPGYLELEGRSIARPPTYLDLRESLATRGPRFTMASPLLDALARALDAYATPGLREARYHSYEELGRRVRRGLNDLGMRRIADLPWASPVLTTFTPPEGWDADEILAACRALGFEIAGESDYLRARGWLQIATMGAVTLADCDALFQGLADRLATDPSPRGPHR